jgi:hypothetical protein
MLDEIKKRFVNEIKLRGYDDRYIDRNEEREILQVAIQLGINIENARASLAEVCDQEGYVLEGHILRIVRSKVEAAMGNDGQIDKQEYDDIVATAREAMQGKKGDREVRRMVVQLMEDTGNNKIRRSWFSNWYKAEKQDLGLI